MGYRIIDTSILMKSLHTHGVSGAIWNFAYSVLEHLCPRCHWCLRSLHTKKFQAWSIVVEVLGVWIKSYTPIVSFTVPLEPLHTDPVHGHQYAQDSTDAFEAFAPKNSKHDQLWHQYLDEILLTHQWCLWCDKILTHHQFDN